MPAHYLDKSCGTIKRSKYQNIQWRHFHNPEHTQGTPTIENHTQGNLAVKQQLKNPLSKPLETVGNLGEETSYLRN